MDANPLSHDLTNHLAAIVRASNAAITSVTMDRRIQSWNAGATDIFGFSSEEALGSDLMMIVPADRMEEALEDYERVKRGEIFTVETLRRHRSGRLIEVAMSLAPIRDAAGQIVGTCAVTHDITARKAVVRQLQEEATVRHRAEEARRASERDFRTFFEMVDVGNVIADAQTYRFQRVNRRFCEITGYTAEELRELTSYSLTDPADVERDRSGWEETIERGATNFTIEKRYRRKDGSTIWVSVTSTLVRDAQGEPLHAIGVIRDVTDRRQAVEAAEKARLELEDRVLERTTALAAATTAASESALRFKTLIENSPLPIISLDLQARVQLWNAAAERLFGWSQAEVLGTELPNLPTGSRDHFATELRAVVASAERQNWQTIRQCRDGSLLKVEIWRAPMFNARHEVFASLAIVMDVTERKFLERALLEATERESRRIGQELHDHLCQHLLGAAFSTKAIATGLPADSETATELDALARLINSAVQQARDIARGLNPVEMEAAGLMAALQELTERPHAGFTCRLECEQPVLLPDAEAALHAYRIAQEAISNAVRHSRGTEIVVRLTEDAQNVYLQIADNGVGLKSPPAAPRGLGLEIMKYRTHAIAGRIWFDTTNGGGTSVVCALPKRR